jgi:hypothetical protein
MWKRDKINVAQARLHLKMDAPAWKNTTTHPNVIDRRARIKIQVMRLEIIPGFNAHSLFSVATIVQWELKKN